MESMTRREKIEHIWYYYKLHIIGVILAVIFIISIISSMVNKKEYILNVYILGKSYSQEKIEEFQKQATHDLIGKSSKKEILVNFIAYDKNGRDPYSAASMQKFVALLATGSIDVLILDRPDFDELGKKEAFLKLDNLTGLPPGLEFIKLRDRDVAEGDYGMILGNNGLLKEAGYDTNNKIVCILSNTKNLDKSVDFIKWLYAK